MEMMSFFKLFSLSKRRQTIIISILSFVVLLLIFGCSDSPEVSTPVPQISPTNTLPDPQTTVNKVPKAELNARSFLTSWQEDSYSDMYALLTEQSQKLIAEEQFIQLYKDVAGEVGLIDLTFNVTPKQTHPDSAQVGYDVIFHSSIFGDISRTDYLMELVLEDNEWRIIWDDSLIMPDLAGGNFLKRDYEIPSRASIYDANDIPLATQADAVAVGLRSEYVLLEESEGLLSLLSTISGLRVDTIITMVENTPLGTYLPIVEVFSGEYERIVNALSGYAAAVIGRYYSRFYPRGGIAPHVTGYISAIQEEEVDEFNRLGYQNFEKVGRDGLEEWGEEYLGGKRGGTLYVFDSEGKIVDQIAQTPSEPGNDVYTTIDKDFQQDVQQAIAGFRGAIVVLERDTGKVLAIASSPKYNPNGFQTENINWDSWLADIYSDLDNPLFNRATQGQYPLGSVFKIITMAAGLESGLYTSETTYDCGYFFEEALGLDLHDWTYDWFLEDGETQPSGLLTLPEGLIRSCNPYFWHIGLDLYEQGLTTAVSDMARGFGLGSPTGIIGVKEEAGNVPDLEEPGDAINLAIGQGDLLVTPLQVAQFVAALGNGGNLNTPWLVDRVVNLAGESVFGLGPEQTGKLPVKEENLDIIQEAMQGVVASVDPRGTAYNAFRGLKIPIAGKTGTAESGSPDPHAWFVGYSLAERENKPDIVVVVLVENVGEGSEWAAPIFRRVIEQYFLGAPQRLYPWEATVGVTKTPTPLFSETPIPESEE